MSKHDHATLCRIAEVATTIMQMCNEMIDCPFCGGDPEQEGEHDRTCICHELDVTLSGPQSWCSCALCTTTPPMPPDKEGM
jgi:hypothetical protein